MKWIVFGMIGVGLLAGLGVASQLLEIVLYFWKPIAVGVGILLVISMGQGLLFPSEMERYLRTPTITGKKYGIIATKRNGTIVVRAPSGADAIDIAGWELRTPEGKNILVASHMVGNFVPQDAVHRGQGIFEVKVESWPSE